jgi:acyl-CoA thioesterase FadM
VSEPTPKTACRLMVRVRFHECDPLGHVNNAVYLNYLEQAAIDHALLVGWSQQRLEREAGGVFVARRHELDYLKPASRIRRGSPGGADVGCDHGDGVRVT